MLNFGAGMSDVIQRRVLIDRQVFGFAPDAVYYVAHQDEFVGAAAIFWEEHEAAQGGES